MREQRGSNLLVALGLGMAMAALCAATAVADSGPQSMEMIGLGTGRDGELTVTEPKTVINRYAQVTQPLAPGDTELFVSSVQEFSAGDLAMVLQTTGLVPEPAPGGSDPINLKDNPVGRWELVRIASAFNEELRLEQPLRYSYAAAVTQIIRVPEYTHVTVLPGASIAAVPWNGSTGGVVALLAAGTLHNQGKIDASGAGFRAGRGAHDAADSMGCAALPREVRPGAHRGEGVAMSGYGPWETGFENVSNGGGGGLCPMAGGGGGGNGAAGGKGGDSQVPFDPESNLGGQGGAGLSSSMLDHLTLGGGGGRGYGEAGAGSPGGAGGGAIFILGKQLTGDGLIIADGEAGKDGAGGGGGGAGGSIYVRVVDSLECGLISAHGGGGGNTATSFMSSGGGGGGGGGGHVLYQARDVSCAIDAGAGLAGGGGAQPTQDTVALHQGVMTRLQSSLMLNCPGNGNLPSVTIQDLSAAVNDTTPTFTIRLSSPVTDCIVTVSVELDGTNAGNATSNGDGANWTYTSSRILGEGTHTARATAVFPNGARISPEVTFRVDTTPPGTDLTGTPPNPSNDSTPTFSFGSNEAGTFKCTLDLAPYVSCTSPFTLPVVQDGSHTFFVKAIDAAGNEDPTPASHVWVTDTRAPETTLTGSLPPNPPNSASATFTFSADETGSTFECQVDTAAYVPCASPYSVSALPEGSRTFRVRAKDAATNVDASPAIHTWVVDTVAPNTTLTTTPPNPDNDSTPTFTFTSNETAVTFECSVDSTVYPGCTSPFTSPLLADGSHTFSVRAKDAATNEDASPASYSWVIDTVPPDTNLTGTPPSLFNRAIATFTFNASETGNTLECKVDGSDYVPCVSPYSTPALADGSHTFWVRAKDAAGNVDHSPPSHTWVVDTLPPDTTITSRPPNPHNSAIATFIFTSTDAESFECNLDSQGYSVCMSPFTTPPLGQGPHTFLVRAKDAAANVDLTPADYTWHVDTVAPNTTLTSTPPDPSNDPTPTFTFTSDESGVTFECQVDTAAYVPCPSPFTTPVLTDGSHTFSVRAKDAATNVDASSASYTWRVDTAAPDTTITSTPPNPSGNSSASFSFTSNEVGTFECSLDLAGYSACTSPVIHTGLAEIEHTFRVRATDVAGNTDASSATYTWTVDRSAPVIPAVIRPEEDSYTNVTSLNVTGTAEASSAVAVSLNGTVVGTTQTDNLGLWELSVDISALSDGPHVLRAVSTDGAGNSSSSANRTFHVDRTRPEIRIVSGPPQVSQERTATFEFASSSDLHHYECDRGQGYTDCPNPFVIPNLPDGSYVLTVRAVDRAGNESSPPASRSWIVDNQPPAVAIQVPVNEGRVNVRRPVFSGTAEPLATVQVFIKDPQGVESLAGQTTAQDGTWSLTSTVIVSNGTYSAKAMATDLAGNTGPSSPVSFIVDTDPPDTEIVRGPPNPDNSRYADFVVRSPENVSKFDCTLDDTAPFDCKAEECEPDSTEKCFRLNLTTVGTKRLEGDHSLKVSARDGAGNIDPEPALHTWTVVIRLPAPPRITEPSNDAQIYDLLPIVSGSTEPKGEVVCYLGDTDTKIGITEANLAGEWSIRPSLEEGTHTLRCQVTDAAGNASAEMSQVTFTVFAPREQAQAIGGGLGCAASGGAPWLALLGLLAGVGRSARWRRH